MSWSPCGADLVVAGLLIGVVGSAVWIKGQIFRPDLTQETTIFLGQNPFQIKTAINQRWESLTAFALSFAISIVGTIQGAQDQACIGSWVRIHPSLLVTLLACGGVGLFLLSLWASKRCAMCEALPRLVELQR